MPWKVFKEGEKFCVYKLDMDGEKTGDSLGCHDSKEKASAQQRALYASENKGINMTATNVYIGSPTVTTSSTSADPEKWYSVEGEEIVPVGKVENVTDIVTPTEKMVDMDGMSFEELRGLISEALHEKFEYSCWLQETFEDFVLVHKDKGLWKVPYTRTGKNVEIASLNQWKEVEITRNIVEKYFKSFAAIKESGENEISGYGILWGDKEHKDLHGEWFDEETEELTSIFKAMGKIPFLFNHGHDKKLKSAVIGEVTDMEEDDVGLWFTAKIREHQLYREYVRPLISKQALFPSSGCLPAAKDKEDTGYIKRWPIMEMTGTHMPAEHRMLDVPISEVKKFYKAIDVELQSDLIGDQEDSEKGEEALKVAQAQLEMELELTKIKGAN